MALVTKYYAARAFDSFAEGAEVTGLSAFARMKLLRRGVIYAEKVDDSPPVEAVSAPAAFPVFKGRWNPGVLVPPASAINEGIGTANPLLIPRPVDKDCSLTGFGIYTQSAGAGSLYCALYRGNADTGVPQTKVAEGAIPLDTAGMCSVSITPVALTPGMYWIAYLASVSVTVAKYVAVGGMRAPAYLSNTDWAMPNAGPIAMYNGNGWDPGGVWDATLVEGGLIYSEDKVPMLALKLAA